jgi:hypothetical protein
MQGASENLARVLNITTTRERIGFFFATGQGQPALSASGISMSRHEMVTWGSGWQATIVLKRPADGAPCL